MAQKHAKKKKGLSIGSYTITVPGLIVIGVVLLALLVGAFLLLNSSFGWIDFKGKNTNTPVVSTTAAPESTAANDVLVTNSPTPETTEEATAEPTEVPATQAPEAEAVTLRFLGEIHADDNILTAANDGTGAYSFEDIFMPVSAIFGDADYTLVDIEGVIGPSDSGYTGKGTFNTPESLVSELADMGVDMLTMANDHALDNFFAGLLSGIENVKESGMAYIGAASTQEEHNTPVVIQVGALKIGFLNYTTTLNSKEKATSADAVKYGVNLAKSSNCKKDAAALKEAGADVIVCAMSWGSDGDKEPSKTQQQAAKALMGAGVDVVLGFGTSTVQPTYILEDKDKDGNVTDRMLCVCSTGSLINGEGVNGIDWGTIIDIEFAPQEDGTWTFGEVSAIPTYIWKSTEDEVNSYKVLSIGEWVEEMPADMTEEDYTRMKEIWENASKVLGESVTIKAN